MQPINLLPDLKRRRRERLQLALPRLLAVAAIIWLLLLSFLYGWGYWQQMDLQRRLQIVNTEIQTLEPVAQRVAEKQELAQVVQELRELVAANTQSRLVPTMDLIASLLPPQISVQQLVIDQERISLTCRSEALAAIGQFYTNLHHSGGFSGVQFSTISSLDRHGYTFTVILSFGGGAQ